ncbi:MAG: zinc ABC transporter substrate-binding protein [Prochlorococcus marinus XMU1425]|nr:zinc ABC transporter substrate-binding protein [Prochlorococcus marinus XMU1425]MCR8533897.1 zinc ABC transporter substrate-binding protein [Prochlorococcus marinus XMU1426]
MSIFQKVLFSKKAPSKSIIKNSLIVGSLIFSGFGHDVLAKGKSYVAVEPLVCDLVKSIALPSDKVTCLVDRKQDVHDLKINPRQAQLLNSADKVFTLGKEMTPTMKNWEDKSNTVVVGVSAIEVENPSSEEGGAFEWAGLFELTAGNYKWSFAKVDGEYADPAMKMVILESDDIELSEKLAEELLGSDQNIEKSNNGILSASDKAFVLNFDQRKDITEFNVEIKKDGKYAFFTEHMPFEFEADEHFFKDLAKNDIEPVAQEPDMGGHSEHGAEGFEWAGTFDLKEGSYKWSFAKVDGEYADPAMKMVILKSGDIEESEELAKELLESDDSTYKADNDVLLASSKAISLNFDQGKESTVFNVEIKESGKYTFFTEHMPFEFEADEHFFKDVSNNDVEPIAQVPDEGDGHHHHHHGHGSLDPHVWHDPANIIKMSKVISKNLKKDISIFNRKDRKSINERIDSTESLLSGLNEWILDQVTTIPEQDRVLVSKHKAMDYYGAAFGFETVSLLDFLGDSSSLRPENISSTLNMLKEENVKAIFPEQIPASKLLKNLSRQSSVPLASNQIFVDGLMMKGNTISVAVHNTCTIVDSLGGSCDKESGSNLESDWYKLSD